MPEQFIVVMALGFTMFLVIMGLWGFFNPRSIVSFIESWSSIGGLWLAVLLRLAFAVVLWLAAPISRTPLVLQTLAVLVAAAGLLLPLFGYTRFKAFIDWWSRLPAGLMRVWSLLAVILGCFVFWSVMQPITITVPEYPIEYR